MGEVIDSRNGQYSRPTADQDVLIGEEARPAAPDGLSDSVGVDPVIVIAQDGERAIARVESRDDLIEPSEIVASVTNEVAAEDDKIGRKLLHTLRHAGQPLLGDGRAVVQVGDERDSIAGELRGEIADRDRDLGRDEPSLLPAKERSGNPLGRPAQGDFGQAFKHRSPTLP